MFKKVVRGVKDLKRLDEIIHIMFSEGFGFVLKKRFKKQKEPILDGPKKLRKLLERLGPTYVKFGQLLSVRPDLVPMAYIKELEKLQDHVAAFSSSEAKKIIEKETGKKISQIFKKFDDKPIASASISQVHKGILKNNKKVAVKVQRPDIQDTIETDIDIMYHLARIAEKHFPPLKKYEPVRVIDEFAKWTRKELDFKIEARNAIIFYENFKGSKKVKFPLVYDKYQTSKVMVSEFIDGVEIADQAEIKKQKINMKKMIQNGLESILTQVFEHGFFHADPHPGNILVQKNGRIAFVDFGIVGHFNSELKNKSIDLFVGILNNDVNRIVETFLSLNTVDTEINIQKFKNEIDEAIFPLQAGKLKDVHISHVLEQVLDIALKHNVRMPVDFVLLGKTILTIEGVAMEYVPDFNLAKTAKPFVNKLLLQQIKPGNLMKGLTETSLKYKDLIENLPQKASKVLDRLAKGNIKVDIDDTDINKLTLELGRSSNRVAYGLVIAALVVGSSITLHLGTTGPISYIAKGGYVLAMIMGLILVVSIIKEEKASKN